MPEEEKELRYTDIDFNQLRWHDSEILELRLYPESFRIMLKMNYMSGEKIDFFNEATLVFLNVSDLILNYNGTGCNLKYYVLNIVREDLGKTPNGKHDWYEYSIHASFPAGAIIKLKSTGFEFTVLPKKHYF